MLNSVGFDVSLRHKCNIFGTAFKVSVLQYGCDSSDFVRRVMTDKKLDWLFEIDDCQEWCDGYYLMGILNYYEHFKKGTCADEYAMWWLGYLYKYWMMTRGTSRYEIYKILPLERFLTTFEFYHTQGWEYVIEDAIRVYQNKTYIV